MDSKKSPCYKCGQDESTCCGCDKYYEWRREQERQKQKPKNHKKKNNLTELSFNDIFIILEMINKCDEKSQTECYETINDIKNIFGGSDNE